MKENVSVTEKQLIANQPWRLGGGGIAPGRQQCGVIYENLSNRVFLGEFIDHLRC